MSLFAHLSEWRFWGLLLLLALIEPSKYAVIQYTESKPFRLDFLLVTFLVNFLGWFGPLLAIHHYKERKKLAKERS